MKRCLILILTLLLVLFPLMLLSPKTQAQSVNEWVARYNNEGVNKEDGAVDMVVDDEGNVYVAGSSENANGDRDFLVVKYNSNGEQQWVARYNGPGNGNDWAYAIAIDSQDNIYVTGESYGSEDYPDYATIKYNSNGEQQWVARYNGPGNRSDWPCAIAIDSQDNIYVTGVSYGSEDYPDYATIKYNSNGEKQWEARYDNGGYDGANVITLDSSGNIYVTGDSEGSETSYDYATIKYDSNGNQLWVARYNGPGNGIDRASAIAIDSSGNIYVTGYSYDSGTHLDYATIKYDFGGNQQWVKRYNGPANFVDFAETLALDSLGNVYVTGYSYGFGTSYDYATIKYNSNGEQQWVARYNGPGNWSDWAYAIAIDSQDNIYVTGESYGSGSDYDYATIKYNSNGKQIWLRRYNGLGNDNDVASAIAVDGSGDIYVTGESWENSINADFVTIKYSSNISDLFSPVTTLIPNPSSPNALGWYKTNVTVTLTAEDIGTSEVANTFFRIGSGGWTKYTEPVVLFYQGAKTFSYFSIDTMGNTEGTKSKTIRIDKTKPTGSIKINSGAASTTSKYVTLSLKAKDTGGSGVHSFRLSNNGTKWTSWKTYKTIYTNWNLTSSTYGGNSNKGIKKVYVQFRDKAYNISSKYYDTIVWQ